MSTPRLLSINVARVGRMMISSGSGQPPRAEATALYKQSVSDLENPSWVRVGRLAVDGDEQADLSVHGGISKAVYMFPVEHYAGWTEFLGAESTSPPALSPGFFGENLTTEGLDEGDLYIGDTLWIGDVQLLVTEPRLPCFKFDARCGARRASRRMFQTGQCGTYLSVQNPGAIQAGQAIEVEPGPRETSVRQSLRLRTRSSDL